MSYSRALPFFLPQPAARDPPPARPPPRLTAPSPAHTELPSPPGQARGGDRRGRNSRGRGAGVGGKAESEGDQGSGAGGQGGQPGRGDLPISRASLGSGSLGGRRWGCGGGSCTFPAGCGSAEPRQSGVCTSIAPFPPGLSHPTRCQGRILQRDDGQDAISTGGGS